MAPWPRSQAVRRDPSRTGPLRKRTSSPQGLSSRLRSPETVLDVTTTRLLANLIGLAQDHPAFRQLAAKVTYCKWSAEDRVKSSFKFRRAEM